MRGSRVIGVLVAAAALGSCGGGGGGADGPTTTVMVFLAADNNLEQFALENLNAMEAVGSSAAVNIVVEVDTKTLPVAGSTTTKRLRVVRDANPAAVTSPVLQNLGETNTATGAAITAFVSWAIDNFPADRYVLILWDHGGGWLGYATDETSGEHLISLAELRQSFEDIRSRTGVGRLDLLGFDACSMATLEVAHELAPFARYLVASAALEPALGWPYDAILAPLVGNPGMSIRDFAASIPPAYQSATTAAGQGEATTLSAIDLDEVASVAAALDALAGALLTFNADVYYEAVGRARYKSDKYIQADPLEPVNVDLGDLAAKVAASAGVPAEVVAAAGELRNRIGGAVFARDQGPLYAEASGLGIHFELRRDPFGPSPFAPSYGDLSLASATSWDEYLDAFGAQSAADVIAPTLTIDQSSNLAGPTPANPATLDVTIVGDDAIDLQGWVAVDDGFGILRVFGVISQEETQPGAAQLSWDGGLIALADGVTASALPLFPLEPGDCDLAAGLVLYRASSLAPDQVLVIVVNCATAGILGFFAITDGPEGEALGALEPAPGSQMKILFPLLDSSGEVFDLDPGAVTLHLPAGAASLFVGRGPAPSGSYVFLGVVSDFVGNSGSDSAAVTVP